MVRNTFLASIDLAAPDRLKTGFQAQAAAHSTQCEKIYLTTGHNSIQPWSKLRSPLGL